MKTIRQLLSNLKEPARSQAIRYCYPNILDKPYKNFILNESPSEALQCAFDWDKVPPGQSFWLGAWLGLRKLEGHDITAALDKLQVEADKRKAAGQKLLN